MSRPGTVPAGRHRIRPIHTDPDGQVTTAHVIRCDSAGEAAGEVSKLGQCWIACTARFGMLTDADGYPRQFDNRDAAVAAVAAAARRKRWQPQ